MLIIRKEQKDVLRQVPLAVFKGKMFIHLQKFFPEDCEILGDTQTRHVIDLGITRAEKHGFQSSGDTCRYISLMFMFGSYFDRDPQISWTEEVLKDKNIVSPRTRMNLLYDKAVDYLERIAGPSGEYYKRTLLKIRGQSFEDFTKADAGDINQVMCSFLKGLYHQKYQELDEGRVDVLTKLAQSQAGRYGMDTQEGVLVYAGLMFMLGSHFDRDMLYPWAAAVLNDQSISDSSLKARKLYKQAISILEQYITINRSMRST